MAKVIMQAVTSIAATSTTANVLSGQRYERSPFQYAVGSLYATSSGAVGDVFAELNVGGNSVSPPMGINIQNRFPVVPDDLVIDGWEILSGQLIQLTGQNTNAAARSLFWRIEIEEVNVG